VLSSGGILPNLSGISFGRYHILELLGEGGMATVYKAYDKRLERDVAVKIIRLGAFPPEQLDGILKRFEHEAKALARLTHPNIVPIMDYGEYEGAPYLVMPYLPGGTLTQFLGSPMPWQEVVGLLLPIAQALDYAHEQSIIHRDIKPSNILLTGRGQPMLSDFGIAKILDLEDGQTLTYTGSGIGTPDYMSPEQGMGNTVDASTDIYSLGSVLYELLTGRKPFIADTPMEVVFKHVNDPLPDPRQFIPDLPEQVVQIFQKALAKKPEDRFGDMAAFAHMLESLLAGIPLSDRDQSKEEMFNKESGVSSSLDEASAPTFAQDSALDVLPPVDFTEIGEDGTFPEAVADKKRSRRIRLILVGGISLAIIIILLVTFLKPGIILKNTPTTTPTNTAFSSPTRIPTQTIARTSTVTPTMTPQPPVEYVVQSGDSCISIANLFGSSVPAIITMNRLNSTCTNMQDGQTILVPILTPVPFTPTATLGSAADSRPTCQTVKYKVQANDSLGSIAQNYRVSVQYIKDWNGLTTDILIIDTELIIPLCMQYPARITTPTPTP
jgi:serine/threonine protein kinase